MLVTAKQRPNTETLARDLNEVMDRYFHQPVSTISDSPEGALDDGLPLDREQLGPLKVGGEEIPIELVRVKDREAGQIWLISSEALSQVPALHDAIEKTWVERHMPEAPLKYRVFGISSAEFITWAASIGIPLLRLWLVSLITIVLARKIIRNPTFDSEADINPGMETVAANTRAIAEAVKDPTERARVDKVIRDRAFKDFAKGSHFLLNNQSKLEYGNDGSLTLYFAPEKPNDSPEGNWLPTLGSQNYSLTFRFYGPRGGIADGTYFPPALQKLN